MNDEIIFACERKLAQAPSRIETLEAQREGDRAEVQSARKDVQELKRRLDKVAHLLVAMGDRVDWDSRSTVVYT